MHVLYCSYLQLISNIYFFSVALYFRFVCVFIWCTIIIRILRACIFSICFHRLFWGTIWAPKMGASSLKLSVRRGGLGWNRFWAPQALIWVPWPETELCEFGFKNARFELHSMHGAPNWNNPCFILCFHARILFWMCVVRVHIQIRNHAITQKSSGARIQFDFDKQQLNCANIIQRQYHLYYY